MGIEDRLRAYFGGQTRFGIESAYLFGSHAAGRPHRESDIDVGVLVDRDQHPTREERFDVRVRLGSELIDALDSNDVEAGPFRREMVRELERLPGFRNVLIHEYVAIDLDRVVAALDELGPIEEFADRLADHLAG